MAWRDVAREHIQRAIDEAIADGLTGKEIVRRIDAAYPFGERANHPYDMWLSERNVALHRLGLAELTLSNRRRIGRATNLAYVSEEEREAQIAAGQQVLPIGDIA